MTVAFATVDGRHVQGDLRGAPLLAVYEVDPDGARLERLSSFAGGAGSEDRIRAAAGAAIVYVGATGPSVVARLAARGIRVATAPGGTAIEDLLAAIVRSLAGDVPERLVV